MIVEAKNENIIAGLGQCIVEMYAAYLYNQQEKQLHNCIYGAVTTGAEWKFLQLNHKIIFIDQDVYYISQIAQIIGILVAIMNNAISAGAKC